jgi:hypothetical protein
MQYVAYDYFFGKLPIIM